MCIRDRGGGGAESFCWRGLGCMKEYTESMRDGFKKRNTDKDEEINMNGEYPLISVIVPVYNTENYLEECISSIVGQTYPNLEILLIDDGSPVSYTHLDVYKRQL